MNRFYCAKVIKMLRTTNKFIEKCCLCATFLNLNRLWGTFWDGLLEKGYAAVCKKGPRVMQKGASRCVKRGSAVPPRRTY